MTRQLEVKPLPLHDELELYFISDEIDITHEEALTRILLLNKIVPRNKSLPINILGYVKRPVRPDTFSFSFDDSWLRYLSIESVS